MGFSFNNNQSTKQGWSNIGIASIGLFFLAVQVYYDMLFDPMLFAFAIVPIFIAIFKAMNYINSDDQDYISLHEDNMLIYRGIFLPQKDITYLDIRYCLLRDDYIIIKYRSRSTFKIKKDWLSSEDERKLKKELEARLQVDNVFRSENRHYFFS